MYIVCMFVCSCKDDDGNQLEPPLHGFLPEELGGPEREDELHLPGDISFDKCTIEDRATSFFTFEILGATFYLPLLLRVWLSSRPSLAVKFTFVSADIVSSL